MQPHIFMIETVNLTPQVMKTMDPEKLNEALVASYIRTIPISIDNIDDMMAAGRLLAMLTNDYSYLYGTLSTFKIWTKLAKANESKEKYAEMVMRRDTLEAITDILKQQYNAVSRLITTKQEINNELKMTGGV